MKWIFRLLGVAVVFLVVLVGAVFLLPAERWARIAADQIEAATGREVGIGGDVALSFWPVLGVRVEALSIGNAEWAGPEPMVEATAAAIGIDPVALMGGALRITSIEAQSPTVRLEARRDGRANWRLDTNPAERGADAAGEAPRSSEADGTTQQSTGQSITVARIDVIDATLVYSAEGSAPLALQGMDLALDWPDPEGPARITLALAPAGKPVEAQVEVTALAALLEGAVSPIAARITTPDGTLGLDGRASTDGALAGDLSLRSDDTDAFLAAFGLPPAGLPDKLGRSVDLLTAITFTPDLRLSLRDLVVDLRRNRVTGAADLALAGVPQVNAQLDAGVLDLLPAGSATTGRTTGGGGASSGGSSAGGWSTEPIDASVLGAFNGDIALSADAIRMEGFNLGKTRALLRNENARMVFDLREVAGYGGMTTGEFVVNNRGGLSVAGRMQIAGVEMQQLLADAAGIDRITGRADMTVNFLGAGQNLDAIMRSLSGDGALRIGRGTLLGIDLDQLFSGTGTGGTTIFDDLAATWTIAGGVLDNRDLLMQLKNYRVSGEGRVNLGGRSLDYRVTPVALRANSGRGLAIPVIFEGPWSNVSIRPDLEAVAEERLDAEKDKLEERAREKLGKELGIAPVDGKTTEDAIKDELQNRLLRKLFE